MLFIEIHKAKFKRIGDVGSPDRQRRIGGRAWHLEKKEPVFFKAAIHGKTYNCPKRALRNAQKNAPAAGCFKGKPGSIFGRMANSVPMATG